MVNVSLAIQYVAVALIVLASAWVVMRKQLPTATRRLRIALALPLLREGRSSWLRTLGRHIAPPSFALGDDCGGCEGCGGGSP